MSKSKQSSATDEQRRNNDYAALGEIIARLIDNPATPLRQIELFIELNDKVAGEADEASVERVEAQRARFMLPFALQQWTVAEAMEAA